MIFFPPNFQFFYFEKSANFLYAPILFLPLLGSSFLGLYLYFLGIRKWVRNLLCFLVSFSRSHIVVFGSNFVVVHSNL